MREHGNGPDVNPDVIAGDNPDVNPNPDPNPDPNVDLDTCNAPAQTHDEPRNAPQGPAAAGHFDNDFADFSPSPSSKPAGESTQGSSRTVTCSGHEQSIGSRLGLMAAAVVLLGALIGACGGLLTLMLYGIEHLALGFVESPELPGPFETDWRRRALSVLIGATVAAVAWFVLRTYARRVPSVRQAVDGESMPWWQTVVHVLLQIGIVGMGLSVGREVAPRELGAMLAQRVARVLHVHDVDLRRLVAISAGAGLAAVYNAPLAGAFFTIEILLVDVSAMTVVLSFLCSALAAWVATLVKGAHVFYLLDGVHAQFSPDLMAFALVAGVVCGVCGALFRRGSSWAESHKSSGASILWTLPAAGLVTGVVAIWVPQVMGNGRATAQLGFTGRPELAFAGLLLISFLAKAIVTLLTIRCGASGGVLTPGIALGASMGCVLGMCWAHITGAQDMSVFALLGAAALLSASQNAPIMAMCLVMELTQAPMTWFVPVAFIAMIAVMTARWFTTHVMDRAHVQEMRV